MPVRLGPRTGCASKASVIKKTLLLLLAFAIVCDFTGCVSMSPQARRERAYRQYVSKQKKKRQKELARAQKAANRAMKRKLKNIEPSEPRITTSVEELSYEPVSTPVAASEPAPAFREPTVDPITVSASSTTPADDVQPQP